MFIGGITNTLSTSFKMENEYRNFSRQYLNWAFVLINTLFFIAMEQELSIKLEARLDYK